LFDAVASGVAAAIVLASVGSVALHQPENAPVLIACGVCFATLLSAGGLFVERTGRLTRTWLAALLALGALAVWLSKGQTVLLLMPLISVTLLATSLRAALGMAALLGVWIGTVTWLSAGAIGARLGDFLAAALFTLAFSQLVQRSERLALDVASKNEQLAQYAAQVEELATMQERQRIAREMHDGLGHFLTSAHVRLEVVRGALRSDRALVGEHLDRAQLLIREGLGELRRSVAVLRSDRTGERPFAAALEALVAELGAAGIATDLHIGGEVRPLSAALEFALFRAAQEALNNVRRHSRARAASLTLHFLEDAVELRVIDDGVGMPDPQDGFGLRGLRERFEPLGGRITMETSEGGGLRLLIAVPL
jgi:signal transduction histidine kinase